MVNYDKAKALLSKHIDVLHAMADELLEKEVLDGKEIDNIIAQHKAGTQGQDSLDDT